jgi:hypothetical protein
MHSLGVHTDQRLASLQLCTFFSHGKRRLCKALIGCFSLRLLFLSENQIHNGTALTAHHYSLCSIIKITEFTWVSSLPTGKPAFLGFA